MRGIYRQQKWNCSSWRTSEVPTLPQSAVDEVPSVARFLSGSGEYRKIKLDQSKNQPWLPLRIDAADLVRAWLNRAEWVEEVMACLEDFTGSNLLERVDVRRSVPSNVLLAFEPFVIFDRDGRAKPGGSSMTSFGTTSGNTFLRRLALRWSTSAYDCSIPGSLPICCAVFTA
ncbi:hypothetical protein V1506DRAFT_526718 [Lipomyces tetrasporus]